MQIFEVSRRVENVLFTKYIIYILLVRLYYSPLLRRLKLPQFYIVSGFARCCTKNPEISSKFPLFQRKKKYFIWFFCHSPSLFFLRINTKWKSSRERRWLPVRLTSGERCHAHGEVAKMWFGPRAHCANRKLGSWIEVVYFNIYLFNF